VTISNEQIAKLAGWKSKQISNVLSEFTVWFRPDGVDDFLPSYTTDLNAIVGLIESEGLGWMVGSNHASKTENKYFAQVEINRTEKPLSC